MRTLESPRKHTTGASRSRNGSPARLDQRSKGLSRTSLISEAVVANYIHSISAGSPRNNRTRGA
jgi:hypothetical protein